MDRGDRYAAASAKPPTGIEPENLLRKHLLEWREQLAREVGTESPCPFCGEPRVRRSDYIRCNLDGINWLDEERHLPDYLNRNPAAARSAASMATTPRSAATSAEGVEKN